MCVFSLCILSVYCVCVCVEKEGGGRRKCISSVSQRVSIWSPAKHLHFILFWYLFCFTHTHTSCSTLRIKSSKKRPQIKDDSKLQKKNWLAGGTAVGVWPLSNHHCITSSFVPNGSAFWGRYVRYALAEGFHFTVIAFTWDYKGCYAVHSFDKRPFPEVPRHAAVLVCWPGSPTMALKAI